MTRKLLRWFGIVALLGSVAGLFQDVHSQYGRRGHGREPRGHRVLRDYRHALEDKNVPQLLKLMSPGYFEDGGNTKNEDDADFDEMREFLDRRLL